MNIYYDTEFLEDGKTIELISIGMVDDDGSELYLINRNAPWSKIRKHDWLMENVYKHLPLDSKGRPDLDNSLYRSKAEIAQSIQGFVLRYLIIREDISFWAWYGAYDHVVLAQLFGRMIDLPPGFPMWTNDVRQKIYELGIDQRRLPRQPEDVKHNALADAKHVKVMYDWLRGDGWTK